MSANQSELASLIDRSATTDGIHATAVPRLFVIRSSRPTLPLHAVYEPAVCIIAQGSKQAILGDAVFTYDRDKYLVISVDVPVIGQIIEASEAEPYLCVKFDLDVATLGMLLLDAPQGPGSGDGQYRDCHLTRRVFSMFFVAHGAVVRLCGFDEIRERVPLLGRCFRSSSARDAFQLPGSAFSLPGGRRPATGDPAGLLSRCRVRERPGPRRRILSCAH